MFIKKIHSLLVVLALVASVTSVFAQQRIWGVSSNGELFSMRTDGSDVQSTTSFVHDETYGHHAIGFTRLRQPDGTYHEELVFATGDSPDPQGEGHQYGSINMITNAGILQMAYNQYLMVNALHGMTDSDQVDAVYAPNVSIDGKWRGIIAYPTSLYSTGIIMNKINMDYSTEFYLTAHEDFVYGVSRGDSNNKGFIYKISEDDMYYAQPVKFYNFTGGVDGLRPVGILTVGQDDFLFGYTSKGGADNKGIFYKVKTDGTGFEKLFDVATKSITKTAGDGKYQTLLDVIAEGYLPLTDESGNYIVHDGTGIYSVAPSGYLVAKISSYSAARLQLVMPHYTPAVMVTSINDGATNVPVDQLVQVKEFLGTTKYFLEISPTPDFSANVISLESADNTFQVTALEEATTYYTRARAAVWPYYGETVSFTTTDNSAQVSSSRLYGLKNLRQFSLDTHTNESKFEFASDLVKDIYAVKQLANGDKIFVSGGGPADGEADGLYKLSPNGIERLYDLGYNSYLDMASTLVEGNDGYVYSAEYTAAGPRMAGFIRYKTDGTSFESVSASHPDILGGTKLVATPDGIYGLTRGRATNLGFIFKIKNDFSGYDIVHQFTADATGSRPEGSMLFGEDGWLYGTTRTGGNYGAGVVFKMQLSGDNYTIIHHFQGTVNGKYPTGPLVQDGNGVIFGTTKLGGKIGKGIVFRINADGSGFQKILDYANLSSAINSAGELAVDDQYVYTLTPEGNIYRLLKDGTGYFSYGESFSTGLQYLPNTAVNAKIISPAHLQENVKPLDNLTLTQIPGATYYIVAFSETSDFSTFQTAMLSDTPFVGELPLKPGTVYFFKIRTSLSPAYGPVTSFKTSPVEEITVLGAPSDESVDVGDYIPETDQIELVLSAQPIFGATSYTIELSHDSTMTSIFYHDEIYTNQAHWDVTGMLGFGQTVYARVKTSLSPAWGPVTWFRTIDYPLEANTYYVYPNPSANSFVLTQQGNTGVQKIVITDLVGNVVYENDAIQAGDPFGENLQPGIYILRIQSEESKRVTRLVKE